MFGNFSRQNPNEEEELEEEVKKKKTRKIK
jgi:hypothetical protein